jgi:hypothetical protein
MKDPIVLFCKSYANDIPVLKRLIDSIQRHNRDNLKLYVSVPSSDYTYSLARTIAGGCTELLCDEEIVEIDKRIYPDNYYNQEVVKSSFWKLGLCDNYVCLDSDSYFIRDFETADFLSQDNIPYTVCHEQHDLFDWIALRSRDIGVLKPELVMLSLRVRDFFNTHRKVYYDFGPSPVIFNCRVWNSLAERLLGPYGLSLADLIYHTPSEFLWYGEWLMKDGSLPLIPREPLFKIFHYRLQWEDYLAQGHTMETIRENYLGVVLQSNWK